VRLKYLIALAGLLSSVALADDGTQTGKRLVDSLCTQCHGLQPIASVRNGAEGWRTTVYKMVQNGSQIRSTAELEAIVGYLAGTYGPGTTPMVTGLLPPGAPLGAAPTARSTAPLKSDAIELPAGKGADLVKAHCTLCHDLGRVVSTRRTAEDWQHYTRVMLARGSLAPGRAATDSIAAYLTEHFGSRPE
jgi:cytochrome c5